MWVCNIMRFCRCGYAGVAVAFGPVTLDIYYGCIGHIPIGIIWSNRIDNKWAYNLFSRAVVTVGNGLQWTDRSGFTIAYQHPWPYQKHQPPCMRITLPNITGILARGAKPIGLFGLVYQLLPLCRTGSNPAVPHLYQVLPPRRRIGIIRCYNELCTVIDCGEYPTWLVI